jgi:uncharacterized YccA/Bax inhibitor family protein
MQFLNYEEAYMFRTANPALTARTFQNAGQANQENAMTIGGTVNKTFILLVLLLVSAAYMWNMLYSNLSDVSGLTKLPVEEIKALAGKFIKFLIAGAIGSLLLAVITVIFKRAAPITAPLYALFEGLLVGSISAIFELQFKGIVIQAVALTTGVMFCLLFAYRTGIIKATENFKLGVFAATGAIGIIYLVTWIMRGFFHTDMPYIHQSGPIGIGFSVVVVIIASLNLVLDFDFIETGAKQNAPKYMEWYGAFGLIVTLVWLYFEILNLLAKIRGRD